MPRHHSTSTPPQLVPAGVVDGNPAIALNTPFGIDADSQPYFDAAGAASGERAYLDIDADTGSLTLTLISEGVAAP